MKDRIKQGQLARIGLFMAIAAMFGVDAANRKFEARKHGGGHGKSLKRGRTGAGGQGRPGFKLVKKMSRRSANKAWEKIHPRPAHTGENRGRSAAWLARATA